MDVKVINEQMALKLKHFLIKTTIKTYLYHRYILTKLGDTQLLILVTTYETIKGESSINFRTVFIVLP